jgi:hypothetical protein
MINVIALTQFAFLTLGIVFLKIMIQANSDYQISRYLQTLNRIALWLLAIPIVWIAFASLCAHINRAPLYHALHIGSALSWLFFAFRFSPVSRCCHRYDCFSWISDCSEDAPPGTTCFGWYASGMPERNATRECGLLHHPPMRKINKHS